MHRKMTKGISRIELYLCDSSIIETPNSGTFFAVCRYQQRTGENKLSLPFATLSAVIGRLFAISPDIMSVFSFQSFSFFSRMICLTFSSFCFELPDRTDHRDSSAGGEKLG